MKKSIKSFRKHYRIILLIITLFLGSTLLTTSVVRADGNIIYVDWAAAGINDGSSWMDAYTDLQDALAAAVTGDQVWVAEGIYKPTTDTDRTATFHLETGVAIYGGFPENGGTWEELDWETNLTTLSGDIGTDDDSADNSYHVVTGSDVDATAILDGFTITGGNANGNSWENKNIGGGMYNSIGSPTINNVIFTLNSAIVGGGIYNNQSSPTLTNVTFTTNTASYGGGMYNYGSSSPTLTDVTFSGNTATNDGGGVYNNTSSPMLINVTFSSNSADSSGGRGGGMHNFESSPTLTNVTFSSNSAHDGGGLFNNINSNPTLTNVSFSGNSATYWGGGINNQSNSNPNLTNVTFSCNSAGESGGGMLNVQSHPTLTNVTFSSNSADYSGGMANSESSATLTNVTFFGNSATNYGGGMGNYYYSGTMTHVTFSGNTAGINGGGMKGERSNPTITNSIFWGNTPDQLDFVLVPFPIISYSVIEGGFTGGTNIITTDPLLGSLADNGGFTQTLALEAESSAIDTADPTSCPAFDQRYYFRPIDGDESGSAVCDMGAYEYGSYEVDFSLTVDVEGEGSVPINPDEDTYHYGDVVTLTASADPGWSFSSWSGDASGEQNPLLFTITGNTSIMANFIQDEYTLSVIVEPFGKGSVIIDPLQDTYHYGDEITLTPTAIPGWSFDNWNGDASGADNPLTITINEDTSITANFLEYFKIYLPFILRN